MNTSYTPKNKDIVNSFIEACHGDKEFRLMVEEMLGKPIKVSVDWEKGTVIFKGETQSKIVKVKDILQGHSKL